MKRVFLYLVLIFTCALVFGQSEDDFEIVQRGGGITITGYTGNLTEIVIPARISGIAVYSIGLDAFNGKGLTRVTLPNGLRTIGESAFAFNKLTAVVIPDTVTAIESNAFERNQISELTLSNSLTFLQGLAFANNRIETLTIPNSLDYIYGSAFLNNPIKTLNLGGVVTVISRAFDGSAVEAVTVRANADIAIMSGLDQSFINFYNSNGKRAGTYVKTGRVWAMR